MSPPHEALARVASTAEPFRPPLDERHGRYRLSFARGARELERVFRLRYDVFNVELGEGLRSSEETGLDRDRFDAQCHHLIVRDEASDAVIGTYRLQVRAMADAGEGFYSAGEFDLAPLAVVDACIELGRACIAAEHRNRTVLFLLWRGLAAYARWNDKRYFFGCSSLTSRDPDAGLALYDELERDGLVHESLHIEPLPHYACVPRAAPGSVRAPPVPVPSVPTLFRTYLRYGARVLGMPALDREFGTVDFLTLLDLAALEPRTLELFAAGLPRRMP